MGQADVFRYAVAGFMALTLFVACVMVAAAAWLDGRQK